MPPTRTQENTHIAIATPLGPDALILRSFRTEETLSRPFVVNARVQSDRLDLALDSLLGKNVTIRYQQRNGTLRFLNGNVARFILGGFRGGQAQYRATLVPWLWFLTRTSDCRIFQNKTALQIIEAVFGEHGFAIYDKKLTESAYQPRDYCVQYRETDFAFVSRLMEEEGIYYYFLHENGKHTMVLADGSKPHPKTPGYESIRFYSPARALASSEWVKSWSVAQQVQAGAYALNDYDFTNPTNSLLAQASVVRQHPLGDLPMFDYPGDYDDHAEGESLARIRIQSLQADYEIAKGESDARGLTPGCVFALAEHARRDQNREYLITSVSRWARAPEDSLRRDPRQNGPAATGNEEPYGSEFTCIDARTLFRPARVTPRPIVHGPQTAVVCGKANDEITTDEHGRVKVQFHWDRDSSGDENSSCWIRVAQLWAGKKWGAMFIPRHGQEVIVEFLEGDPDRPIITGRVYNATHKPPYDLPAHATVSAIKSNTSKGNGHNEIRFEDKKDSEQLYLHAQRRMDVRVGANLYETAGGNREEVVGHEDKGDFNRLVCKDINAHNKGGRYDKTEKVLNRTVVEDVIEDHQKNQTVKVAERLTLNADEIAAEAGTALSLKSDTTTVQGASALNLKAGTVYIEGTQAIHLKSGGNFVVIDAAGVSIKGTLVGINSGGAAQAAGSPLTIEDPDIEEPLDAAAATSSLPGQHHGGGGGSPRTRVRRTVVLTRAPEPPPPIPPGTTGFGNNTANEVELVETAEITGAPPATTPAVPTETRRQYVNLPRAVGGTQHKENGRIVYVKARIRWRDSTDASSLAGRSVRFYAVPDGGNKAVGSLHNSLKSGFDAANGPANKTVQTGADGWTPAVPFTVSRYGGDKFQIFATLLPTDSGGLAAGTYEVWRKIEFEVDAMKRPSGVDYMDVASGVIADFVAAHAGCFTEAIQVGRNDSPAHNRLLNYSGLGAFHTSCASASGARYIHLMYVDTVLTGEAVQNNMTFNAVTVPAGSTALRLAIDATRANFLPSATGWVVSATWTDPVSGATGNIPLANFGSPAATGDYARHPNQGGDFDRWEFDLSMNGSGATAGTRVNITMRYTSQKHLSGVQIGQTTTVGMRFRELRANAGTGFDLANATLQTSIHESSHAFGLASRQRPDGTANPDFITAGGGHCSHTTTCVMTPALHEHTAFCDFCSDNLRARKLEAINVQPGDAMV